MFMDEVEELLSLFWVMIPTQMKATSAQESDTSFEKNFTW